MKFHGVLETCLYVDDLFAAEQFYQSILKLDFASRQEDRHVFFRCGNQMVLIFKTQASNAVDSPLPRHGTEGAGHIAFAAQAHEIDTWISQLKSYGVPLEQIMAWPDGARSVYFRDPAKNCIEIAESRIWGISE